MRALKADYGQTIPDCQPLSIAQSTCLEGSAHPAPSMYATHPCTLGGAVLHADADKSAVIDDGEQVTVAVQREIGQAAKTGIVRLSAAIRRRRRCTIWQVGLATLL
jgi:hypothetical protein